MVSEYPAGDLEFTVDEIAGGGFYEEERFLWDCVVQLLDMVDVVSADCDDLLSLLQERGHVQGKDSGTGEKRAGRWSMITSFASITGEKERLDPHKYY